MASMDSFMTEVLRTAKNAGDEKRRERERMAKLVESESASTKKSERFDKKEERNFLKEMEQLQQTGRMDVARLEAVAKGQKAPSFTPEKVADFRRNAMQDASKEIGEMADLNGNIPNPHYLDAKTGKPVAGQAQFLSPAGIQEMVNRRSGELFQNYTNGLIGQPQQVAQPGIQAEVQTATATEPRMRGFSGLNVHDGSQAPEDVDYKQKLIRSMVDANGQSGSNFKKFTLNGAAEAPPVPAQAPVVPGVTPPGNATSRIQQIIQQQQAAPAQPPIIDGSRSGGYQYFKPAFAGLKKEAGNFRDVMAMHFDSSPAPVAPVTQQPAFGPVKTDKAFDEIMKKRGKKPIDQAINLWSR